MELNSAQSISDNSNCDQCIGDRKTKAKKKPREFDFFRFPKRRIALMFLYYGWDYDGLVVQQSTEKTVEEEMKKALLKTRLIEKWSTCEWSRCGRTDKGVSAFKQVASLVVRSTDPDSPEIFWSEESCPKSRISGPRSELQYIKILNAVLPKSVRVLAWASVPQDFSARFSCKERVYKYCFPRAGLNIKNMEEAGRLLEGEHDFRNFCRIDNNHKRLNQSYSRTIYSCRLRVLSSHRPVDNSTSKDTDDDETPFDMIELTCRASGFLWNQIRSIVAVLYEIGRGKETKEVITDLLDIAKTPCKPAYGISTAVPLCLFDCSYGDISLKWQWDIISLKSVISQLLRLWSEFQSKAAMLSNMIGEIGTMIPEVANDYSGLQTFLCPLRESQKEYVPIRKRPLCDSLETKRIKQQAKCAKLS
ncbi:hypothetical protein AB6A40_003365 [Gnathostoma spinigerum]|uniref:tRNA pseudouridine synthase n=1 Tax=Gnathostoma spinigerum TaxID=75299 RepID=A0ABD6EAK4_9BILA